SVCLCFFPSGIRPVYYSQQSYPASTYLIYTAVETAGQAIIHLLSSAAFPLFAMQMLIYIGVTCASNLSSHNCTWSSFTACNTKVSKRKSADTNGKLEVR
ncbi:hypothetical protein EDB92DRAFT_1803715, partial [Lactarius akahatsu]